MIKTSMGHHYPSFAKGTPTGHSKLNIDNSLVSKSRGTNRKKDGVTISGYTSFEKKKVKKVDR